MTVDLPAPRIEVPAVADSVMLCEAYGPVPQGEGPSLGVHASFVRFGGCNLKCRFCDSAYTWDASRYNLRKEITRTHIDRVIGTVLSHHTGTVVLTGGEPLLHQDQPGWQALVAHLDEAGKRLEVETNGTVIPGPVAMSRIAQFNVSPKLANSGESPARRTRPEALAALAATRRAHFKFVCASAEDVDEAAVFVAAHEIPHQRTWIMPMGTTATQVLMRTKILAPRAIQHGFNMTTRLHVLVWGDERGR